MAGILYTKKTVTNLNNTAAQGAKNKARNKISSQVRKATCACKTHCQKQQFRAFFSSSLQPPKVVWKERAFQEVSNATMNAKNGGRSQREMAGEVDGEYTGPDTTTFRPLKIISAKTVQTYVATNETIDALGKSYESGVVNVASVKKKSVHKKKPAPTDDEPAVVVAENAVSKKRPATEADVPSRDRGAVIARSNTNIKSSCWIRTMIRVNESWVIEPCADYWKPFAMQVVCNEVLPQFSCLDTLPTVSEFFKLLKKRWEDVCLEAAEFFVSEHFCQPTVTTWGWSQLCTAFVRYNLFRGLKTVDISNFLSVLVPIRPILRDATVFNSVVQLVLVSTSADIGFAQIEYQHSDSDSSSSSHDLMDFHVSSPKDEEFVDTSADGTAPDPTQISLPPPVNQLSLPVTTNVSASLSNLASISRLVANQTRDSRKLGDSHGEVMSKINHLERALLDSLVAQDQAFRDLIKNIRQEAHNDTNVLSLALKAVRAQNAILSTDLADVRKEENHLNMSTQLGFLVDYINRGGDAKKGEGGSSHPQPSPDDQNRPSGGSASRGSGSSGSIRRDDKRDSSKKRRSSSGGGGSGTGGESYGPYGSYKRDAEWWLYGKNRF
ncbi:hypothetical protein F511_37344 [Dorcoceras hygrometricum]|uniref:Uncharacterized protein n=1 Tax=Dorcoceras hygrometricum TaxID=472368 RepID=A0A2Z7ABY0_9LAMI|nr:hypothetical protein F511_37344 [Dorcoceras hygrometricum]